MHLSIHHHMDQTRVIGNGVSFHPNSLAEAIVSKKRFSIPSQFIFDENEDVDDDTTIPRKPDTWIHDAIQNERKISKGTPGQ